MVGEAAGESGRTVQRYIRLTELIAELLDAVDHKVISMKVGEKLSYLSVEEQGWVWGLCENVICTDSGQTSRMFESAEQTGIAVSGHGSGYPDEENKEPGTGDDSRKKDCRLFSGNLQQTADRGSDLSVIGTVEKTTGR